MKATVYPLASRTAQNFSPKYPGVPFTFIRGVVLHTTEGGGWPAYDGGALAPHFTALPDTTKQTLVWRQHFALNESSRALENHPGGVQTNNTNVIQIELVGTSEKGGPGMYWPEAPDWALKALADFLKWLAAEWGTSLASTVKWVAYPASYGNTSTRLNGAAWNAYKGILGHQHVPENVHGDPGLFPIARLLNFTKEDFVLATKDDVKAALAEVLQENKGTIGAAVHSQPLFRDVKADGSALTIGDVLHLLRGTNDAFGLLQDAVESVHANLVTTQKTLADLQATVNKLTPTQPTS